MRGTFLAGVVAGLVTAGYGVAVIVVSQAMKLFVRRVHPWVLMLAGGVSVQPWRRTHPYSDQLS